MPPDSHRSAAAPPRILPVAQPDEEQARILAKTLPTPDGRPLNVFSTLAHRPELLRRVNALGGYFFVSSVIEARDRELVILRTAARIGSTYEIVQHRRLALSAGVRPEEIDAVLAFSTTHPWSAGDRALLAFTDELLTADSVSDAAWEALSPRYDAVARAELCILIGFYRMLGGFLNGVRVALDDSACLEQGA